MGLADILAIIKGVIYFPDTILEFVKILQKTPQENHEAILDASRKEAMNYEETGRPQW